MADNFFFTSTLAFVDFGPQAFVVRGPRSSSLNFRTNLAYRPLLHRRACTLAGIQINPMIFVSLRSSRVVNNHKGSSDHIQKRHPHQHLVVHAKFEKGGRHVQRVGKISHGGGDSKYKKNKNDDDDDNDDDDGNKDLKNSEKINSDKSKQDQSGNPNNKKPARVPNKESYDNGDDFNRILEFFSSDDLKATKQLIKRVRYDIDHRVGTNINQWINLERKLYELKQIVEEEEELEAVRIQISLFFGLEQLPAEIEFIIVLTSLIVAIGLFIALFYLSEFSKDFWQPFLPF